MDCNLYKDKKQTMRILILIPFIGILAAHAQVISVRKTLNNAVVNQTNNAIYSTVNQGVNDVFTAPGKIFRKVKSANQSNNGGYNNNGNNNNNNSNGNTVTNQQVSGSVNNSQSTQNVTVTKTAESDFAAGTETIYSADFSSTAAGSFPDNWITNGNGEVRTVDGQEGNWLQISSNGAFAPSQLPELPENFSLEFDAIFHPSPGKDAHYLLYFYSTKDKTADFKEGSYPGNAGIYFAFNTAAGEIDAENFEKGKPGIIDSHVKTDLLKSELSNKAHIGIIRQKSRLALYVNGTKTFASPGALPAGYTFDAFKFGALFMDKDDFMLVSNINLAGY